MKIKVAFGAVLAAAVICLYLLLQVTSERNRLRARLAEARATGAKIQAEADRLMKAQIPESELARMKSDQREAIRLRGEVTRLKQAAAAAELAADKARVSEPEGAPRQEALALELAALPEDNPQVQVHKTPLLTAEVPAGHSLLVGGWETEGGKRTFVLVNPADDPGTGGITVSSKWVELSNETAEQLGFAGYLDGSGQGSAVLESTTAQGFVRALEQEQGVKIIGAPNVSTLPGRQARVAVLDRGNTLGGPVDYGPQLDVIPEMGDGGAVRMVLRASVTLPKQQ